MNYKIKRMAIDSILKVIDNSPTRQYGYNFSQITRDRFDLWVKYVFSILDIISDNNIMGMHVLNTKYRILSISNNDMDDYLSKTGKINQSLLDLANLLFRL